MKVAILSMQRVLNYGSVLQAYSLKKMIENLTNEQVEFIDIDRLQLIYINENIGTSADYSGIKDNRGKLYNIIYKIINKAKKRKYFKNIREFQNNELRLIDTNPNKHYDLVIIGSDEVFKCEKYICLQLYGEINNGDYIATYAASSGSAEYENIKIEDINKVKSAVNKIFSMSVRDQHTYDYIGKLYKKDIKLHLDPVLVGCISDRVHKAVKQKNFMIVYAYPERIYDEKEIMAIKRFAFSRNLKIVAIGGEQRWCKEFLPISPFEVIDYFYAADYVITDTFHGAIFSIITNKKFGVFLRKSNENKLGDLLNRLELNSQLITSVDQIENVLENKIDYTKVQKIIEFEKMRSNEYLKRIIEQIK